MHVKSHGMTGGYAYVVDTGPTGAQWRFKKNSDPRQWNVFVSPHATTLLAYGYDGTRDLIFEQFDAMGGTLADHSINRVDFAMDFRTKGFELHQDQFVAHAHTKVRPHWGEKTKTTDRNAPAAVLRGRRLESVTVGKQPGRQIIVYDKRREAIERQKYHWFEAWGIDRHDKNAEVWRLEVRAGKNELKDKYQIRRFADIEASIGDVIVNALSDVRYLNDLQGDSNVTRQGLHPIWHAAQETASRDLTEFRSGLTPGQIIEIERHNAQERYAQLLLGNGIGLAISTGHSDAEILENLHVIINTHLKQIESRETSKLSKAINRARGRLIFINS